MDNLTIIAADVYLVGPNVKRLKFSEDMGEIYESLTLVKITTSDGSTGVSGVTLFSENNFDGSLAESLKTLLPAIIGKSASDPESIYSYLMGRYCNMTPKAQGAIDIALWDCLAKSKQLPLYKLLGGTRNTMPAYASIPLLMQVDEYIDTINSLHNDYGFTVFKVHIWCNLEKDVSLIDALFKHFNDKGYAFIFDLEERYNLQDSIALAKALKKIDCPWIEAPMIDANLADYTLLREETDIPIIAAGNSLESLGLIKLGIEANAWDSVRVDANFAGGISGVKTIMQYAEAQGMGSELQAWGYTLSQAANLHLSLAFERTQYFEAPVPYELRDVCVNTKLIARNDEIQAPGGNGLGMEIDWDKVDAQLIRHYRITD